MHAAICCCRRLGSHWNIVSRLTLVTGAASMYDEAGLRMAVGLTIDAQPNSTSRPGVEWGVGES